MNGQENRDANNQVKIKTGKSTRGREFTLVKGQSRLDVRKYSFSQRTVNQWNRYAANCAHSSSNSFNMFKKRIANYLVKAVYTLDACTCVLSISQRLPCPQPSKVFIGWQSC